MEESKQRKARDTQERRIEEPERRLFDILFGLFLPLVCILFDPGLIRSGEFLLFGTPPLAEYRLLIYTEVLIGSILLMVAFRMDTPSGTLAGGLFAGAVVSAAIGLLILPFSIFGLMFIIGILGFSPFLTSFVYIRRGLQAMKVRPGGGKHVASWRPVTLGFLLILGIPAATQFSINHAIDNRIEILFTGSPAEVSSAASGLKVLRPFSEIEDLTWRYSRLRDDERRVIVAAAYTTITGEDLDYHINKILD